jgi:hypothetical protein
MALTSVDAIYAALLSLLPSPENRKLNRSPLAVNRWLLR